MSDLARLKRLKSRGFTLVEVMVALLVMAVLATMAWQGIDAMVRTRDVSSDVVERTLRLSTVMSQWEQDLASFQSTSPGPNKSRVIERPMQFDGAAFRLVRRTDEGMQMVVWAVRDGVLQRWAGPAVTGASQLQDQWLRSLQLIGNEPQQVRALEGVQSMQVYFYVDNAWGNAQSSLGVDQAAGAPPLAAGAAGGGASSPVAGGANPNTGTSPPPAAGTPPAPTNPRLPQGVRVVFGFAGAGDAVRTVTRDVQIKRQEP